MHHLHDLGSPALHIPGQRMRWRIHTAPHSPVVPHSPVGAPHSQERALRSLQVPRRPRRSPAGVSRRPEVVDSHTRSAAHRTRRAAHRSWAAGSHTGPAAGSCWEAHHSWAVPRSRRGRHSLPAADNSVPWHQDQPWHKRNAEI